MSHKAPKYWGSWKGKIANAIAVERRPLTWGEIRLATGLSDDALTTAFEELSEAGDLRYDPREEVYSLPPSLYKEYLSYLESAPSGTTQTEESEDKPSVVENGFSDVCEVCGKTGAPLCSQHTRDFGAGRVYPCPACGRYTVSKGENQGYLCPSCKDQVSELQSKQRSRGKRYFGHPHIVQTFRREYNLLSASRFVSADDVSAAIADVVKSAEVEVLLSSPWITLNDMSKLIEERALSGIRVRLIAKPAEEGSQYHELFSRWIKAGTIEIIPEDELHAKMVIADGRTMYVGSSNITYQGLNRWLEAGIVTEDPVLVKPAYDFLSGVMKEARMKTLTKQKKALGESEGEW